jgi:hypothetical protein
MTMKRVLGPGVCCLVALAAAGCFGFERKSTVTAPTATGVSALLGNWSSASVIPSPASCSDFKWNVTEQTTNTARGTFSATCANDVKLAGTAQGTLSGSVLNWTAEGTASAASLVSCRFSLAGTAELAGDSIRVPYSGDTCVGRVSGVEVLRKQ